MPELIAILRGIRADETAEVVTTLLDSGISGIEIPLNSPDPFASVSIAVEAARDHKVVDPLIGAGTVLNRDDVLRVRDVGGTLIVSPNIDEETIRSAIDAGLTCMPGVLTPSECLRAMEYGATDLKVFPASMLGPQGIKSLRAVLPSKISLYAVGGVGPQEFSSYTQAGAAGFGLGSSLYQPGMSAEKIGTLARQCVNAMDAALI